MKNKKLIVMKKQKVRMIQRNFHKIQSVIKKNPNINQYWNKRKNIKLKTFLANKETINTNIVILSRKLRSIKYENYGFLLYNDVFLINEVDIYIIIYLKIF